MFGYKETTAWKALPGAAAGLVLLAACSGGGPADQVPRSAAQPPQGSEWTATGMGPLTEWLFQGVGEIWSGSLYQNIYTVENRSDEHAIRYYTTRTRGDGRGNRSISVDVALADGSPGRAGLVFGLDRERNTYHLFVRESDGAFTAYRRHESGIDHLASVVLPSNGQLFHRLEVREEGESVQLWANGERVATITRQGLTQGELGIIAFGMGQFGYSNFAKLEDNGWRG